MELSLPPAPLVVSSALKAQAPLVVTGELAPSFKTSKTSQPSSSYPNRTLCLQLSLQTELENRCRLVWSGSTTNVLRLGSRLAKAGGAGAVYCSHRVPYGYQCGLQLGLAVPVQWLWLVALHWY